MKQHTDHQQAPVQSDLSLQFYRVPKAAKLLDIDRVTLYAKVKRGELPPFQTVGDIKGYTGAQILAIYGRDGS